MSRKKSNFASLFLVLALCMLAWEFWPLSVTQNSFLFDPLVSDFAYNACVLESAILDQSWVISHPRSIDFGDVAKINLSSTAEKVASELMEYESCEITIAAQLESMDAIIKPGNKILSSFDQRSPLNFEWQIYPTTADLNGKIWISVDSSTRDGPDQRVPLFVIPFSIRILSIFGMRPLIFRLLFAALFFIAAGYSVISGWGESE